MLSLKTLLRAAITLIVLAAIASLLTHNVPSTAQTTSTAPIRHYYLTKGNFDGSHALSACASGYHMASLWEIHEPSNLTYNKTLGLNLADSGAGPPTDVTGYMRTGFQANGSNVAGLANCNKWTSNSSSAFGTQALLGSSGENPGSVVSPWAQSTQACNVANFVWCVQN